MQITPRQRRNAGVVQITEPLAGTASCQGLKGGKPPLDRSETAAAAAAASGGCADKGRGDQNVKQYTKLCLNLRVSCVRPMAAANSQLSGGPAERGQQETNQWAKLYTGISLYIGQTSVNRGVLNLSSFLLNLS